MGSVNVDMIVRGSRLPAPGETMTGGCYSMAAGGKGANQAVAAARLGAEVTLLARVGRDRFGDDALAGYCQQGINTDRIIRDDTLPTGVALILVNERGENSISVASGANDALSPADVRHAAGLFFQADMLLLQLEIPLETVTCAARLAHDAGVPVMLDPAPAPQAPLDASLLELVDYLKPNEHEAQHLTGIRVSDAATASALVCRGVRTAVVTLGSRGACWATRTDSDIVQSGSVPGCAVQAVDSTAAGDAFSAALAYALATGHPLDVAVRHANLAGALTTTRLGAQPSLPTRDELDRFEALQA
ncbi:MAG TPA: ribokinase [Pirellulales bacterium]